MSNPENPLQTIPDWAKNVICPVCGAITTPLKAKADKQWGESITYQCYSCKAVVVVNTSSPTKMVPGDFSSSTFNWKEVSLTAQPFTDDLLVRNDFKGATRPERPWTRMTPSSILWDKFWDQYESKGDVNIDNLLQNAEKFRESNKYIELIKTLPVWMTELSGYVVIRKGSFFEIVGKANK